MSKVPTMLALGNTCDVGCGGRPLVWMGVYVGQKPNYPGQVVLSAGCCCIASCRCAARTPCCQGHPRYCLMRPRPSWRRAYTRAVLGLIENRPGTDPGRLVTSSSVCLCETCLSAHRSKTYARRRRRFNITPNPPIASKLIVAGSGTSCMAIRAYPSPESGLSTDKSDEFPAKK